MQVIFLFGMGKPRLKGQEKLSRAYTQVNRVHSVKGISPAITTDKRNYILVTNETSGNIKKKKK